MSKKKDYTERQEVSDTNLQEMIDNGEIFGNQDTDFSTNYQAYETARKLASQIRDCDCAHDGPHVHIAIERPEGSTLSNDEFQTMVQRHFNEVLKKKLREKEQEKKRLKLFGRK